MFHLSSLPFQLNLNRGYAVELFSPKYCDPLRDLVLFVQLKQVENVHGGVLLLVMLQAKRILASEVYKRIMQFNPEFMWHCFNTNPIPYNLRKGSRLLIPPTKSVNFGTNLVTFR